MTPSSKEVSARPPKVTGLTETTVSVADRSADAASSATAIVTVAQD